MTALENLPKREELEAVTQMMGVDKFEQLRGGDSALKVIEIVVMLRLISAIRNHR